MSPGGCCPRSSSAFARGRRARRCQRVDTRLTAGGRLWEGRLLGRGALQGGFAVNKRRWSNRWRSIGSSVIVLLVACGLPASASAAPTKPFEVTLTPAQVPAGVTVGAYTVTLTNETGTQQLGSADVTVPGAFTVVSQPTLNRPGTVSESDKVLHLRTLNLPPGASVTATVGLRMTCVSGAYTWKAAAKQSNDFNGPPGNNLGPVKGSLTTTVTGSCALRFVTHPARPGKKKKKPAARL